MYINARAKHFLISNYSFSTQTQWGERNGLNGADSDGTISSVENFFEDESLGSNSSDSEDDAAMTAPPAAEIYKRYFGERAWKGTVEKVQASNSPTHPPCLVARCIHRHEPQAHRDDSLISAACLVI